MNLYSQLLKAIEEKRWGNYTNADKKDDKEFIEIHLSDAAKACQTISEEWAKGFVRWKDLNYINYQMRDDEFYHKRDLLKHISEATVFTLDELIQLYKNSEHGKH